MSSSLGDGELDSVMKPRVPNEGSLAHLLLLFNLWTAPVTPTTHGSLCYGFSAVGLLWGSEYPVCVSGTINRSLGVGEGGGVGMWERPMSCGQCACLMPPSCVVEEGGLWEGKGTRP